MVATTTPSGITSEVRRLCKHMGFSTEPVFIQVNARADAISGECFDTTAKQVIEHGGSSVFGWLIWEWPGILIEAEFHAVWQKPDGTLLDVTKKDDGESVVLFIPDPGRKHEGVRVDNVRLPIGKDQKIKQLISLKKQIYSIMPKQNGPVVMDEDDLHHLIFLQNQVQELAFLLSISRESKRAASLSSRKQRSR